MRVRGAALPHIAHVYVPVFRGGERARVAHTSFLTRAQGLGIGIQANGATVTILHEIRTCGAFCGCFLSSEYRFLREKI